MSLTTQKQPELLAGEPRDTYTLSDVRRAIPRELFERDDRKATAFMLRIVLGLLVCEVAAWWLWSQSLWWLFPVCWLIAGTFLFGLFEVAHNCGHHAFFVSRRSNKIMGHLAAFPLIYPFTQWKLWHDAHHRRPNATGQTLLEQFEGRMTLKLDTAFSPLDVQQAQAARAQGGLSWAVYYVSRRMVPVAVFMAPILLSVLFARDLRPQDRRACRISLLFSVVATTACMSAIVVASGSWFSLIHFWIAPLAIYACWLGYYSLLQHTGESIPVYAQDEWGNHAQLHAVVNTRIPVWLGWIHGGGEFHAVHHIAPTLPSYHLRQAHDALLESPYASVMRSVPFSLREFARLQRTCQVWDAEQSTYRTFSSLASPQPPYD